MNLVIRRTLHNKAVRDYYTADPADILVDAHKQEKLFYRIFPQQVDVGKKKLATFDWILYRVSDGTEQVAPRELIQLLSATRDMQLRAIELGHKEPPGENLFDNMAIKDAFPEVSRTRFDSLRRIPASRTFARETSRAEDPQTPASLASIWDVTEVEALKVANELIAVGFFEYTGTEEAPEFWEPFLYRSALDMVPGTAEADDVDRKTRGLFQDRDRS